MAAASSYANSLSNLMAAGQRQNRPQPREMGGMRPTPMASYSAPQRPTPMPRMQGINTQGGAAPNPDQYNNALSAYGAGMQSRGYAPYGAMQNPALGVPAGNMQPPAWQDMRRAYQGAQWQPQVNTQGGGAYGIGPTAVSQSPMAASGSYGAMLGAVNQQRQSPTPMASYSGQPQVPQGRRYLNQMQFAPSPSIRQLMANRGGNY